MQKPLVSVVIATHNRQDLLPQAVRSILDQTYQNFEIVIVDDASEDVTPEVIRGLTESDPRIRSIRSDKNVGPGAARNLGIALAKGDFVAIMDDDDLADPHRLESELEVFFREPEVMLVFSSIQWVDDQLKPVNLFPGILENGVFPSDPNDVFRLLYLESNKIPNTTIMIRRELVGRYVYPETPWIGEDWYLFMQLAAAGVRMRAIPTPLVTTRRGSNHTGLMARPRDSVFQAQREVLRKTREWLLRENIREFDSLHKHALANQILRESRHFIGLKGIAMIVQAFFLWPGNPKIREQILWYLNKVKTKLTGPERVNRNV